MPKDSFKLQYTNPIMPAVHKFNVHKYSCRAKTQLFLQYNNKLGQFTNTTILAVRKLKYSCSSQTHSFLQFTITIIPAVHKHKYSCSTQTQLFKQYTKSSNHGECTQAQLFVQYINTIVCTIHTQIYF